MRSKFIACLFVCLCSPAAWAEARIPFSCELASGPDVIGYETLRLEGFVNPGRGIVKYSHIVTDAQGKTTTSGQGEARFGSEAGKITLSVLKSDGALAGVEIAEELLRSPAKVHGVFGLKEISCSLFQSTFFQPGFPSPEEFDRYDLPVTFFGAQKDLKRKQFQSVNGLFTFELSLYPESPPTKNYPAIPAHTKMRVMLGAPVVDERNDDPVNVWYLLFGDGKEISLTLDSPQDVAGIRKMLGADSAALDLVHPYGQKSPVKLSIRCSASACTVSAHASR